MKRAVRYLGQTASRVGFGRTGGGVSRAHTGRNAAWNSKDEALAAFSLLTDVDARPIGFARHDELLAGCSPDWWIDEDEGGCEWTGGVEVKCPAPHTHIGYLLGDGYVPAKYWPQLQFSMWVCGVEDLVLHELPPAPPAVYRLTLGSGRLTTMVHA